ncbi:adiponectin receptor protein 1 [Pochonia chlamydosporia 170]|uniref:Adiponectin receptor protein 1 n=1 Tax=Pochonia chlamydosporia 170 TaxID=1380566 RepID=A0A179F0W1_METCM|nr:adiponectin receptor protein 1 [Pochonia chlamydosporia 170]OAQ59061.2 adiponectin receptor protein 1 [Pochonia chlamydosporia 170]
MWGSGISCIHFALRCARSTLRLTFFSALTMTAGLCIALTLRSWFHQPKYRTMRTLMYCFLGASLFIPVAAAWDAFGTVEVLDKAVGFRSFVWLAAINLLGGLLYTTRVPERWFPGKFDLFGQSHNLMHALVMAGAFIRLQGLMDVYASWRVDGSMSAYCQGGVSAGNLLGLITYNHNRRVLESSVDKVII